MKILTIRTPSWADPGPRNRREIYWVQIPSVNPNVYGLATYCRAAAIMAVKEHLNAMVPTFLITVRRTNVPHVDECTGLLS